MPRAEAYWTTEREVHGVPLVVRSYRMGETYYGQVANKQPGAVIARAQGADRNEAERTALAAATKRLR